MMFGLRAQVWRGASAAVFVPALAQRGATTDAQVKKAYMHALRLLHPDKLGEVGYWMAAGGDDDGITNM
jgi:hypothetical protein